MENENVITVNETPEQLAAEEAAFASAFTETRGVEEGAALETDPADDAQPVAPEAPVVGDAQPAAVTPEPAAAQPRLIGGLTEDQVAAALARTGNLQSTVDKMAGRMGQLMQQIEQLRSNPPTTPAQQQTLDLKLEKLSAGFPELAEMLRQDLQPLQGAPAGEQQVAPVALTQEQIDQMVAARLNENNSRVNEQIEIRVLTIAHPDWEQVIRTPEFALFRDNVLPAGVGSQLMESEDAAFISKNLSEFKAWRDRITPRPTDPVVPEQVAQTQSTRAKRLANAVLPAGSAATPVVSALTEEDGFAAGFNNERKRAGY